MGNCSLTVKEKYVFSAQMPKWPNNLIDDIKFPRKEELSRLANFILIDIRLIFIIVSVYVTISTAIATTANNEAANDTSGNREFNVSSRSDHQNLQVSHVTNAVLWNCREKSVTNQYYKVLYGLLFTAFSLILLVFIITRLSVLCGNISEELANLKQALWRIQLLKYMRKQVKKYKNKLDEFYEQKELFDWFSKEWIRNHHISTEEITRRHKKTNLSKISKIQFSVLIIPFFEALLLIVALPFMLTTYDLNPIGCLVGPDEDAIEYDNVTGKVHLQFTESVLKYQIGALIISVVLIILLALLALLLPVQYCKIIKWMAVKISRKPDKQKTVIT